MCPGCSRCHYGANGTCLPYGDEVSVASDDNGPPSGDTMGWWVVGGRKATHAFKFESLKQKPDNSVHPRPHNRGQERCKIWKEAWPSAPPMRPII